jgi:post-segregation antitoxin (ccd killing protein)
MELREFSMIVRLEVPEDIAADLQAQGQDLSRAALEAFGIEEYRAGRLTQWQLTRLLGFATRIETDGFLKERGVELEYTREDLERERESFQRLGI